MNITTRQSYVTLIVIIMNANIGCVCNYPILSPMTPHDIVDTENSYILDTRNSNDRIARLVDTQSTIEQIIKYSLHSEQVKCAAVYGTIIADGKSRNVISIHCLIIQPDDTSTEATIERAVTSVLFDNTYKVAGAVFVKRDTNKYVLIVNVLD